MTARCDLWDLPVEQYACPQHRGELVPALPEVEVLGQPFEAAYPGRCVRCDGGIVPGDRIARAADGGYVHIEARRCRS